MEAPAWFLREFAFYFAMGRLDRRTPEKIQQRIPPRDLPHGAGPFDTHAFYGSWQLLGARYWF